MANSDNPTVTGVELKQLRQALGLSVAQAARQCEVTPRTWMRWEASAQPPPGAVKLFKLLNGRTVKITEE